MNEPMNVRVARGAAIMDKIDPDWYKPHRIDLRTLDMRSGSDCVAGQVLGAFSDIWEHVASTQDTGFNVKFSDWSDDIDSSIFPRDRKAFDRLGELWTKEILERRLKDVNFEQSASN